ncbi:MAG: ribonuclease H family protein [bacterium]
MAKKNIAYAYYIEDTGENGVIASWEVCQKKVSGVKARYKGFQSIQEAEKWLACGAQYDIQKYSPLEEGIYFDAGTGRGNGVEVRVTDEKGNSLLSTILQKEEINAYGNYGLPKGTTNNYGELLGCQFALIIALKKKRNRIFGDSALVITYWSKGFIKTKLVAKDTVELSCTVVKLRKQFEKNGGIIEHISGDINPADLGFHK